MGIEIGLLDYLSVLTGCAYLSDLRNPENLWYIRHTLRAKIGPEAFSLKEWNDAVAYLTGEDAKSDTPQQAFSYLQDFSEKVKRQR